MASKKKNNTNQTTNKILTNLPDFDIKNRYYYDSSLIDLKDPKGKQLYTEAQEQSLKNTLKSVDSSNDKIQQAIIFLETVTASERAKEEACISYYSKLLLDYQQQVKDKELIEIYKELQYNFESMLVDGEFFKNIKNNQARLIQRMSILRSSIKTYKSNLMALTDEFRAHSLRDAQLFGPLMGNQYFIEQVLQYEDQDSYIQKLYGYIDHFIEQYKPNIKINKLPGRKEGLIAMIAADLRSYLYEQGDLLIIDENIEQVWKQYITQMSRNVLNLITNEKYNKEFNQRLFKIINDLQSELGIVAQQKRDDLNYKLEQAKDSLSKESDSDNRQKLQKKIEEITASLNRLILIKKRPGQSENLYFRLHTKTSAGDIQEKIDQGIIPNQYNIAGSAAVDSLGTILIDPNVANIFATFKQIEKQMKIVTKMAVKDRRNLKTYTDKYIEANKNIQQSLDNYYKQRQYPDFTKIFITNDSAKLYWDVGGHEFSGREFSIADALAQLYSLDESLLVNQDILIHVIINITSATADQKPDLERYLSIFAGLLMFGDIYNIAQDAAKFVQQSSTVIDGIHTIHLYNIDGMYIPSSIILERICNTFITFNNNYDMAARATVYFDSKNKPSFDNYPYSEEDWDRVSNIMFTKTKIQLHFLKGLFDFIREYLTKNI